MSEIKKPLFEDFYNIDDPRGPSLSEFNEYEAAVKEWSLNSGIDDYYDPYCPICSSCGETGCCTPVACQQHPNGKYCEGNLNELKFGYLMFMDLYELISEDKKLLDKANDIYDKNWDGIYDEVYKNNQDDTNNEEE